MKGQPALMTSGSIRRRMLLFAFPILLGNLFQQLYNTVDSLIVGSCLGPEALAAVTSTGSLIHLMIGFFNGFAIGTGALVARYIGSEDDRSVSRCVHTAVTVGLLVSIVFSVITAVGARTLLTWMGSPEDVLPLSSRYLTIYFAGSAAMIMYNTFVGILQAAGDSTHPLIYLVVSSVINVILDILFVSSLGMGVEGAAIATVISQCVSAILALLRLLRSGGSVRLRPAQLGISLEQLRGIARYGLPTGMQSSVIDLSNVLIQSYINSFGAAAMAGIGACFKIEGFAFLPTIAFAGALSTFVSQNVGADRYDRVRSGMRFGLIAVMLLSEAIGLFSFLFGSRLLSFFSTDPEVIRYGMYRIRSCSLFMLLPAFAHTMSAVMRGLGKPMVPMAVMLISWCAVRVAVLMTVGRVWHSIDLVCWIYPFTWVLSLLAYSVYWLRLRKKLPGYKTA